MTLSAINLQAWFANIGLLEGCDYEHSGGEQLDHALLPGHQNVQQMFA